MVPVETVAPTRVLRASDSLDKSDVHHAFVEVLHGESALDVLVGRWRVGKDDRPIIVGRVGSHADQAAGEQVSPCRMAK